MDQIETDNFFNESFQLKRLNEDYQKYGYLYIAFDFDDTLFDYRGEGNRCSKMIELARFCGNSSKFKTFLFTVREGKYLNFAVEQCKALGIKFDSINENPDSKSRKPFYHVLFDDRAGLGQTYEVFIQFLKQNNLI